MQGASRWSQAAARRVGRSGVKVADALHVEKTMGPPPMGPRAPNSAQSAAPALLLHVGAATRRAVKRKVRKVRREHILMAWTHSDRGPLFVAACTRPLKTFVSLLGLSKSNRQCSREHTFPQLAQHGPFQYRQRASIRGLTWAGALPPLPQPIRSVSPSARRPHRSCDARRDTRGKRRPATSLPRLPIMSSKILGCATLTAHGGASCTSHIIAATSGHVETSIRPSLVAPNLTGDLIPHTVRNMYR